MNVSVEQPTVITKLDVPTYQEPTDAIVIQATTAMAHIAQVYSQHSRIVFIDLTLTSKNYY